MDSRLLRGNDALSKPPMAFFVMPEDFNRASSFPPLDGSHSFDSPSLDGRGRGRVGFF